MSAEVTVRPAGPEDHATRASGAPLLFLEGDPGYYGERGSVHGFAPASWRTPDAAFQVVRCAGLRDPLLAEMKVRTEALR